MKEVILVAGFIALLILVLVIVQKIIQWRHQKIYQQAFSPQWQAIVQDNVALYRILPNKLKQRLHGHIHFFLYDKTFIGCDGLEINDLIRLTIAANACLLVLNRKKRIYPGFTSILVYPDTFLSEQRSFDGLLEHRGTSIRLGEAWHRGPVVLSWQDVLQGSRNGADGHNVVLHEFAHKLDGENQLMDGLPVLRERQHYAEWAAVLNAEYQQFLERVEKHANTVIDEYGGESAVEFFAVITEAFFEKAQQMQQNLPELYQQLKRFYELDPASWER